MVSLTMHDDIESIECVPRTRMEDLVVCVRKVVKTYGSAGDRNVVLNGLDMNVEKGTIYGLLGSSGCGKTTLLNCIAGVKKTESGSIWVLGGAPGEKGSGVPGPGIGFMPQELSLIDRFTIAENMRFFGLLCGRDSDYITKRSKELIELLELPCETRWAANLSGGQKRRLSLAIALLHNPQLLVLDEPTVGVDPILRVGIWDHLIKVSTQERVTVIVTTHYIEEAKQANRVGLMRNGILLAEDSPDNLLMKYNTTTLEEAFLKLAQKQLDDVPPVSAVIPNYDPSYGYGNYKRTDTTIHVSSLKRLTVILWKLIIDTSRNPAGYFFIFLLPLLQASLFCFTVGRDPVGLHLAVVNEEIRDYGSCGRFRTFNTTINDNDSECKFEMLSCQLLDVLDSRKADYHMESFRTMKEAKAEVDKGKSWAILYFSANYTDNLLDRLDHGQALSDDIMAASDLQVTLDMSNEAIGHFMQTQFLSAAKEVLDSISNQCGYDPRTYDLPMKRYPDVYGVEDTSYVNFIVPGILGVLGFLLASACIGGYVLTDKEEGISERSKVCGLNTLEAYGAYMLLNIVIVAFQSGIIMLVIFVFFDQHNNGSWTLIYMLTFLQGISGVTFGLLFATLVKDFTTFTYVNVGYNFSSVFISGANWPIEGMETALRHFSKSLHFTLVIQSFRSILYRGWDMKKEAVYDGFGVAAIWIVVHIILTIIFVQRNSKRE